MFSLLVGLPILFQAVQAAGILVHIEVQRQATYFLSLPSSKDNGLPIAKYLTQYADFVQPGSFFSDWGYGCLSSDAEAELAHWPPFLGVAMTYLQETYPAIENSTDGQQLLSFLHGVSAHQNTDATWHGIKLSNGLLEAMAAADFNGDSEAAHSILDTGGDMLLAQRFATEDNGFDHLVTSWAVPVKDILAIYAKLGVRVNSLKLRYCMARGYAAIAALRRVGTVLADRYKSQSPFMTNEIDRYCLGSIEEATTTTLACWASLEKWALGGHIPAGNNIWDHCEPMRTISRRGKAGPYRSRQAVRHTYPDLFADFELIVEEELESIIYEEQGDVLILRSKNYHPHMMVSQNPKNRPYYLTPSIPYAEFGSSLAISEAKHSVELIIGSPRETDVRDEPARGGVYVIPLLQPGSLLLSIPLKSSSRSYHSETQFVFTKQARRSSYFGKSVVILIIEGIECLAVLSASKVELFRSVNGTMETIATTTIFDSRYTDSFVNSPIADSLEVIRMGNHDVLALLRPWHAKSQGEVILLRSQDLVCEDFDLATAIMYLRPDPSTKSKHFGRSLSYSERGILVVGSEDRVDAYHVNNQLTTMSKLFHLDDPAMQTPGSSFGARLVIHNNILYVASHNSNIDGKAQAGNVLVYHIGRLYKKNSRDKTIPWTVTHIHTITAATTKAFGHFGKELTVAPGGIYISAPDYDGRGAVFFMKSPHSNRKTGKKRRSAHNVTVSPCLIGYQPNSRFGSQVKVSSSGLVIVTAPSEVGLSDSHRMAGRAYLYDHLQCD